MSFTLPRSLSPSKVSSFRDCAMAFRFTAIEGLADAPTIWTVKGTLVHTALERLFWRHGRGERTEKAAALELSIAWGALQNHPDFLGLTLSESEVDRFKIESQTLVANYFRLEDPNEVDPVGIEVTLEARLGEVRLRGIIDRLDRTPDGDLVVIDYKTGRAPSAGFEQSKLLGVQIYALLCEEVLGRRPAEVRLLHLREPTVITAYPSDQTIRGHRRKALAVWSAIEQACDGEDFRPRPSPLCNYCRFKPYCPAYGGNPTDAALSLGIEASSKGQP